MIVLCLEGCHGCGKTELCKRFESEGFSILDEAFLDMPDHGIHPQSLLMETTWICSWFQRLLKCAKDMSDRGNSHERTVYIADRSPYSAVLYCHHGDLLAPVIQQQMKEVREHAGIDILTIYLSVEKETLWRRVQERLREEPERVLYKEDRRDWLDQVASFYDSFEWDMKVDNTEEDVTLSLRKLMEKTIRVACVQVPSLRKAAAVNAPDLVAAALKDAENHAEEKEGPEAGGERGTVVKAGATSRRIAAPRPGVENVCS